MNDEAWIFLYIYSFSMTSNESEDKSSWVLITAVFSTVKRFRRIQLVEMDCIPIFVLYL
jgi:hypothetical protein